MEKKIHDIDSRKFGTGALKVHLDIKPATVKHLDTFMCRGQYKRPYKICRYTFTPSAKSSVDTMGF